MDEGARVRRPYWIAHLSDQHVGLQDGPCDPMTAFSTTIDAICSMPQQPDAILLTGDIAEHGSDSEYLVACVMLERLQVPLYVVAGNHDDRAALRRHFRLPGTGDEPIRYSVDLGPVRLVVVDSTRPGEDRGELDGEQLEWLRGELAAAPLRPTLLAMHHPPVTTGIPVWDGLCLKRDSRDALGDVLRAHPQVTRIAAGHLHRVLVGELAARTVITAPSTFSQARLSVEAASFEVDPAPAAFMVHSVFNGELISHYQLASEADG